MEKHAPVSVIREAALHSDRWRFQRDQELEVVWKEHEGSVDERVEALSAAVINGSEDAPGACEVGRQPVGSEDTQLNSVARRDDESPSIASGKVENPEPARAQPAQVPEVGPSLWGGEWHRGMSRRWRQSEAQMVLEGRAVVIAIRRIIYRVGAHRPRHLMLCDAMSVVLALTEGRSSSPRQLPVCRQWAACCLACGTSVSVRWVSSKHNAVDDASRGRAGRLGPLPRTTGATATLTATPAGRLPRATTQPADGPRRLAEARRRRRRA